jgi:hypothetical protein
MLASTLHHSTTSQVAPGSSRKNKLVARTQRFVEQATEAVEQAIGA